MWSYIQSFGPFLLLALAKAQTPSGSSCPTTVPAAVPAPVVADGFEVRVIASGLTRPRSIVFDNAGHLLVVQSGVGVQALTLQDDGGTCLSVSKSKAVVSDSSLNHGLTLSYDGKFLLASSPEAAYIWNYNSTTASTTSNSRILVQNMTTSDHTVRTLHLSKFVQGTLIVTRGSTSNLDPAAEQKSSGHSQIKAFNILNMTGPYDFNRDGRLLGWGLRNDEGVAEHPVTGGIYTLEASADQITRYGVDIHENNPAEKMNYLGTLVNNTSKNQGGNFGYPLCFAAWNVTEIPRHAKIQTGTQFAIGTPNSTVNDNFCRNSHVAPRLAFQAHMTPLTILFDKAGSVAWVTFHGSWDRVPPVGYKVSAIKFANGEPVEPSTSTTSLIDIVTNQNVANCPTSCFRPVGLAWDGKGRLYFSSDATGEIYVIQAKSSSTNDAILNASQGVTTASAATTTPTGAASKQVSWSRSLMAVVGASLVWVLM